MHTWKLWFCQLQHDRTFLVSLHEDICQQENHFSQRWKLRTSPVVRNPPANAGHAGSIPGTHGKIPHAVGQLDLCTAAAESVLTAYEPQPLKPKHPSLSSSTREASTVRSPGTATKRSPRSSQAEKAWKPSNEDPAAAKTKLKVITNKRQLQTATSQEEKFPPS